MRLLILAGLVLAACASPRPRPVEPPAPVTKAGAQVMILGTYHFDDGGANLVQSPPDDHRAPRRQAEIADVAARLARFAPTKIVVERVDQTALTERYAANAPLAANEVEQLGFRLARQLRLPAPIAIDHKLDMDFERLLGAANAAGDRVFLEMFAQAVARIQAETNAQVGRSVRASLVAMNAPERLAHDRALYLAMARVRHGDDLAGADVLAAWYQRNFRIFANLARVVTSPGDRVLVIYGQGHAPILRELVAASPNMVLVEPNAYLAGD